MNTSMLEQYQIRFLLPEVYKSKFYVAVESNIITQLHLFLTTQKLSEIKSLKTELSNAVQNLTHEPDWGSDCDITLFISPTQCTFNSGILSDVDYTINTNDILSIVDSYIEWIETNDYEKYIR
jgi:hypothetical protein